MGEPSEFEVLVAADKMPPCPICGKPLRTPFAPVVFFAHGMAALAHDECRSKLIEGTVNR
jgi:hypothetical protein